MHVAAIVIIYYEMRINILLIGLYYECYSLTNKIIICVLSRIITCVMTLIISILNILKKYIINNQHIKEKSMTLTIKIK